MDNFSLKTFVLGPIRANCYVLSAASTGETVVIDPGDEPDVLMDYLSPLHSQKLTVLMTHGHFDHVGAALALEQELGAKVFIHADDEGLLLGQVPGTHPVPPPESYTVFSRGQAWPFSRRHISFLHTPGHTPGSVCFLFDNLVFSGDTLFKDYIGRTDLPGSSDSAMRSSLHRLMALQGDRVVYPGHGGFTTLDDERAYNPYVFAI